MIIDISKDLVKELRKRTGISIVKCKQALIKTNGNIELAIDYIRTLGLQINLNKSMRSTVSGLIATKISDNHQIGAIIEINCETDFVAKNDIFQKFTEIVITTALNESINDISVLKTKIQPQCLILMNKVGENVQISRFAVLKGAFLSSYVHGLKIGVIISVSGKIDKNIIKNIAMHIAARNPKYIYINNVPKEIMIREHRIQTDIAMKFEKSKKIVEKIVEGRMCKFLNEFVLTEQDFIMNTNKSVGDILDENCMKIDDFVRFEMGNSN